MSQLQNLLTTLQDSFGLQPVWACELEFYLPDAADEAKTLAAIDSIALGCLPAEKERGKFQYEIATTTYDNSEQFIHFAQNLRQELQHQLHANFTAKPFADDYGSALHFHLHLQDENGVNRFTRAPNDGDYSTCLLYVINGLLETLSDNMKVFSPNDYSRFSDVGYDSPTHICWGPNNRSVALRLPTAPLNSKRIEHRVAAADADIAACIEAILHGVIFGLKQQKMPPEPIYGNAWDAHYGLEKIIPSP